MEVLTFKTNIKCGGCISTVTPFLNNENNIRKWQVDTDNPDKILTVSGTNVDPQKVKNIVQQAGFQAEFIRIQGTGGGDL